MLHPFYVFNEVEAFFSNLKTLNYFLIAVLRVLILVLFSEVLLMLVFSQEKKHS